MTKFINGTQLKMIAIISMLIDHIGVAFFPGNDIFRIIGRLAFIIFCYTLVEGFFYSSDIKKYCLRLLVFCLIAEIPFNLFKSNAVFDIYHQNTFFTLLIGLLLMYYCNKVNSIYLHFLYVILACSLAMIIHSDYEAFGILVIFIFYYFKDTPLVAYGLIIALNIISALYEPVFNFTYAQMAGGLAIIPIYLYNGKKGRGMKYFFYAFYPLHFLILLLIKYLI